MRVIDVWSAVAFFLLLLVGFVFFAKWIPPLSPADSADQIAELFRARTGPILVGMVLMIVGSACYLPWTVVLADLIKEIEDRSSFLYGTQLAAGVMAAGTFFLPAMVWATAAFRPERSPEITQGHGGFRLVALHHSDCPVHCAVRDVGHRNIHRPSRGAGLPAVGRLRAAVDQLHVSAGVRRVLHETGSTCLERPVRLVDTVCGIHCLVLHHDCADSKGGAARRSSACAGRSVAARDETPDLPSPWFPAYPGYPVVPVGLPTIGKR
jgi:hypothetical protein